MPGSFIDSNVVLYSLSKDESKQRRALELLASGGLISTQVLGEVANVTRFSRIEFLVERSVGHEPGEQPVSKAIEIRSDT